MFCSIACALALATLASWANAACVPDVPEELLIHPQVLSHPVVLKALNEVEKALQKLYDENITRDGLSFAIIHASSPMPVFTFNAGVLRYNETTMNHTDNAENTIISDSIFRVNSVTKNFATTSALILSRLSNHAVTLDTLVRCLLPSFHLPLLDWADGGSEITFGMLASHMSGITRESFSTGFNMVLSIGKATTNAIGELWAAQTVESVIKGVGSTGLMFKPGERAAYSNAGIGILGAAVVSYYNEITHQDLVWSQLATRELLEPLNMTHSFFGEVPDSLSPFISVPGGDNWADLVVGEGYNPAAGMWSSANDLSKYLHAVWLQPSPTLVSPSDRRRALKPVYALPDGKQQVGLGWEIMLHSVPTSSDTSDTNMTKTYSIYGKSGSGGGWRSWIDIIPNLGYGLVILSQTAGLESYGMLSPSSISSSTHDILISAFTEALSTEMERKFAGTYSNGRYTGILTDKVNTNNKNLTTYARLDFQEQTLYMRELVVNGSSALEAIDRVGWPGSSAEERFFSRPAGVVLEPAGGASEVDVFGSGAQVFRMVLAGEEMCNWYDYDGYKDQNGWPLTKVVLVETGKGVELHYPPFDTVVTRS